MLILISKGEKLVEQAYFSILVGFYDFCCIDKILTSADDELLQTDKSGIIHIELFEKSMTPQAVFLEKYKECFFLNFFVSISES